MAGSDIPDRLKENQEEGEEEEHRQLQSVMRFTQMQKTKWSRASWKDKFFHLAKFLMFFFFGFVFEKMSSSIPMFLVMLFTHVGKRLNSRSQMFFKTGVLKSFAIFTEQNLCWSLFLIKFQHCRPAFSFKKRLQHRYFSVNIAKFLRRSFYRRSVHYTFPNVFLMIDDLYFRVIFYYCKIRPRNRNNFVTDRSKFFSFLLFNHFAFTDICK